MSHQDGLGNNGTEPTGLTKPDAGDNRVQKKNENVAHAEDRIRLRQLKNSGRFGEFAYHTPGKLRLPGTGRHVVNAPEL